MTPTPDDIQRARELLYRVERNLRGTARYAPDMNDATLAIHLLATTVRNSIVDVKRIIDILKGPDPQ